MKAAGLPHAKASDEITPADKLAILKSLKDRKGGGAQAVTSSSSLTKKKPISSTFGIGVEEHDNEGRVVCLEYSDFYLVNVYVPNSGNALLRLSYRQQWDKDFCAYLKKLEKTKPVVVCGDFNVAHNWQNDTASS